MAAGTTMTGTVIGYNGAVFYGGKQYFDGRLFSNVGAVSIYGTQAIPAKVAAAEILIPTVTSQSTTNTSYYCRNLGGSIGRRHFDSYSQRNCVF
jgi:hypothetical protein